MAASSSLSWLCRVGPRMLEFFCLTTLPQAIPASSKSADRRHSMRSTALHSACGCGSNSPRTQRHCVLDMCYAAFGLGRGFALLGQCDHRGVQLGLPGLILISSGSFYVRATSPHNHWKPSQTPPPLYCLCLLAMALCVLEAGVLLMKAASAVLERRLTQKAAGVKTNLIPSIGRGIPHGPKQLACFMSQAIFLSWYSHIFSWQSSSFLNGVLVAFSHLSFLSNSASYVSV